MSPTRTWSPSSSGIHLSKEAQKKTPGRAGLRKETTWRATERDWNRARMYARSHALGAHAARDSVGEGAGTYRGRRRPLSRPRRRRSVSIALQSQANWLLRPGAARGAHGEAPGRRPRQWSPSTGGQLVATSRSRTRLAERDYERELCASVGGCQSPHARAPRSAQHSAAARLRGHRTRRQWRAIRRVSARWTRR